MNTFEKNLRKDTFLSGGLVAIGIVWVALAAIKVPVGVEPEHVVPAFNVTSTPAPLQAGTGARFATPSANAERAASTKV